MKDLAPLKFVNCDDPQKAVAYILQDWRSRNGCLVVNYIYYANFITLQQDARFQESMRLSDYILIDGIGMQLYMKMVKGLWPHNLNGTDLNPVFIRQLDAAGIPVAFYGTTSENIRKAEENISAGLANPSIYYVQDGFTPLDWERIEPGSALFVGMGSPRQENWVHENRDIIEEKKLLVITVGGFFDFASGFYVRAPKPVRHLKLEWAWRTMLHPGRHLKKRLKDISILYRPAIDRMRRNDRFINIRELN